LELSEEVKSTTFKAFQQTVLANNAKLFASNGTQTYTTINGRVITFEINPQSDDQSQIIQVDGIDRGNALRLDRNYRHWPMAWSSNNAVQSLSMKGRWTFDTATTTNTTPSGIVTTTSDVSQRLIYDVTDPLHPKRIESMAPVLTKYPIKAAAVGGYDQYFDDSGSVLHNDTIQSLVFQFGIPYVTSFRMNWRRSGLQAQHGSEKSTFRFRQRQIEHKFAANEK
jgi:hypothetical protein